MYYITVAMMLAAAVLGIYSLTDLKDTPEGIRLTMAFIVTSVLVAFGGFVWLYSL